LSVAVALLAGVSCVQVFPWLPPYWLSALLLVAGIALFWRNDAIRAIGACLVGIAWACVIGQVVMQQRLPVSQSGSDFRIEGRVLGLPQKEDESVRFDFRIENGPDGAPVGEKVRLGWYGQGAPQIEPGSRWQLTARLKRPRGVLNPGGMDFEKNALAQRIAATGYVREPHSARLLSNGRGIDAWRDRLSRTIALSLPEGRGRFVQALAIGDTRELSAEDWETLRATGLTHQIAISGFHVGMVGGFGALLMLGCYRLWPTLGRRLPRPQGAALAALVFAFGYTALAGFALPTVRTMLMIAAVLIAKLLRRAQSGRESYALALIAVLVFDPLSVLAPGFWLSFIGVGWLLWCLPRQRDGGWLRPFFEAQGVAVLGLLPLTVWFFGQASLPGPVANLIGIPVISLAVVPLALIGMLLLPISPGAAAFFWQMSAAVMDLLWSLLERIAHWPAAMLWLPEPSLLALALACIGAFWLLLPRAVPGKLLAALLFLPLLWPELHLPAPGQAEIDVIDVGQGLSVLVRTTHHRLLFDAGPASPRGLDFGEAAVVPSLRALGVNGLDTLLISHGDNDHSGGMEAVRRAFPGVRTLGVEGWARPGMGLCQMKQAWRWDGVNFRVLHPPPLFPYMKNESSCVLRVEAGGRVALLPGDISRHVEARLLREQRPQLNADLLIVPHHGSLTSSSEPFIAQVSPRWAVMSTGADNRFHLPRQEIVERYLQSGAEVMDTAQTGALRFRLDAIGAELLSSRRQDLRRYWREQGAGTSGGSRPPSAQAMLSATEK
jgi:competence protein ComEC